MTWSHFSRIKSAFSVIVLYERVTRYFTAPTAYACVLTYEKALNSSLNMCLLHHIHREKSECMRLLKSSCNVTSLNLRLHCSNLSWIALSLNFLSLYPFSRLLPSFPGDWHPGCAMSDLQSGFFRCAALTKSPANFSGLPQRSHPSVSTNYMTGPYIQRKICNQSTLSSNSNILKNEPADLAFCLFLVFEHLLARQAQLCLSVHSSTESSCTYPGIHKNRINNPKSPHIQGR